MDMDATSNSSYKCFSLDVCRSAPVNPRYQRHIFDFEKNVDGCAIFEWAMKNWKICYYFIGVYLVSVFAGRHLMKSHPPFQLRGALLSWNLILAVFSIFCAWRSVTAILYQIELEGFYQSLCELRVFSKQFQQSVALYLTLFGYSKLLELGDTAFIVLRKTPLIFLHWFHHATVCFFAWSSNAYPSVIHIYGMAMNYFIHSFMYSYYVLKVLKIRVPTPVSMAITSLQLLQMLGGLFITLYTYYMRATPEVGCCVVDEANQIALCIYFAYFVLFGNYFLQSYFFKKRVHLESVKKKD